MFKQLKHADLKFKCSKCKFFKSKVHYLGYLVGVDGVQPLPEKLEAIKKLLAPTNVDELQQFLGITSFYRKFIPFYANITNCLTKFLRKRTEFQWSKQCNNAFNILKEELCKMPSLQHPHPNEPFKLFRDASNYSYSGILHQTQDEKPAQLIPIAYFSGSFNWTQKLWNVTQKECYAVYRSINKFSFYLTGAECTLYCDHKLLAPFLMTWMKTKTMDRWALELQQYNINFQHVAGKHNVVADAISCLKTANLYKEAKDWEVSKTLESIDDIMENIILEIHPHSLSSINNPVNPDYLLAQQKSEKFCKNKVKQLHHQKSWILSWMAKEYLGNWYNCITTGHQQ